MRNTWKLFLLGVAIPLAGCHHYGFMVKREQELDCPTDIRQTVPWCMGEDAMFHCPCGPSSHYHGLRPPAWRPWPTSGAEWRDAYGAMPTAYGQPTIEPVAPGPELVPTEALPSHATPPTPPGGAEAPVEETRVINPSYESLGPFGMAPAAPATPNSMRPHKVGTTRRARSLDVARDSWINH